LVSYFKYSSKLSSPPFEGTIPEGGWKDSGKTTKIDTLSTKADLPVQIPTEDPSYTKQVH